MAKTTPITIDLLNTERVRTMVEILAEILDQYDRQMADEPWRLSRGMGYAEVQVSTADASQIRAALAVGEPPTCATCGGERFVCDLGIAAGSNECAHPDCTENRRPCPSCAPTEPGGAT